MKPDTSQGTSPDRARAHGAQEIPEVPAGNRADCLHASLMAAPWDDEPESPEETEAIQEAYQDIEREAVVYDEELDSLLCSGES